MTENTSRWSRSKERYRTAALFVGPLIYFLLYYDAGVNWMDEGMLIRPVERILAGQVPYRDFYGFYSPGRWYFFAPLFALFGYHFLITRIVWAIGHAAASALIYRVARRAVPATYALIPAVAVTLAPGPWHKTPFFLGVIVGMWLVLWQAEKPSAARAAVVGAGTALLFFFRQDVGVFYACLGGIFTLTVSGGKRVRDASVMAIVFIAVTGLWMSCFIAVGGGSEMFRQVAFAAAKGVTTNRIPYPMPFDQLQPATGFDTVLVALSRVAFYIPFVVFIGYVAAWIRDRKSIRDREVHECIVVGVSAILAWNQVRLRSDLPHLYQAYPVVDLMAALSIYRLSRWNRMAAFAAGAVFLAVIGGSAFSSNDLHHGSIRAIEGRTVRHANPRLYVKLTPAENESVTRVENMTRKYSDPGDPIFLAPSIPLFYFLTGTRNPTEWDVVRPGFLWGDKDQRRAASELERAETKLVVLYEPPTGVANEKRLEEVYRILYDYIVDNYELVETMDYFKFYTPKRAGGAERTTDGDDRSQ